MARIMDLIIRKKKCKVKLEWGLYNVRKIFEKMDGHPCIRDCIDRVEPIVYHIDYSWKYHDERESFFRTTKTRTER